MDYLDFDLHVSQRLGAEYTVTVINSPGGRAQATVAFPLDDLTLDRHLKGLETALLRAGTVRRAVHMSTEETESITDFGQQLFGALFAGDVGLAFRRSQDRVRAERKGLRVRLRVDDPVLSALPWEFVYDPQLGDYVCLSIETPLVRYLDGTKPLETLAVQQPLIVLAMVSSPSDRAQLDVDSEVQRVKEATAGLEASGRLRVKWMEGASWRELQRTLRTGDYHIFHFIGHGGFDATAGEGVLAFTGTNGKAQMLGATEVASLLADEKSLRLVILNSCLGARGNASNVFSSTSATLVRRGVPAVVAMQYEISDRAALEFSQSLYEAIADGMPVDGAVSEARKAVRLSARNSLEWGTPVLHMCAPDGVLFKVEATATRPVVAAGTTTPPVPPPAKSHAVDAPAPPSATTRRTAPPSTRNSRTTLIGAGVAGAILFGAYALRPTDDAAVTSAGGSAALLDSSRAVTPTPNSAPPPSINPTPSGAAAVTDARTHIAIARAYIQAVSGGTAREVAGVVDFRARACDEREVWSAEKCQTVISDGKDGKAFFIDAIVPDGSDWRRSNIRTLFPEENMRRVAGDPRYSEVKLLLEYMSTAGNGWYVNHEGADGAKRVVREYLAHMVRNATIGRAYIQAMSGGAGPHAVPGIVDYAAMDCTPATVWTEDKCQREVYDGKDGKTLFYEAIVADAGSERWQDSNIRYLLPEADLRRVMTDSSLAAGPRFMLTTMSTADNGWYKGLEGPGRAKALLRSYMEAMSR